MQLMLPQPRLKLNKKQVLPPLQRQRPKQKLLLVP
jgi:hypothetical protein